MDVLPDLRQVRWVSLRVRPPGREVLARLGRGAVFATVGASMFAEGSAVIPMVVGGALGALAGVLGSSSGQTPPSGIALVPWGVIVDSTDATSAIRWTGIRKLHVRYQGAHDGSVHARVEIDSIRGRFVGFALDTIDLGALATGLEEVTAASSRPLAVDLEGHRVEDGLPFAERIVGAASHLVSTLGEAFALAPHSYRGARMATRDEGPVVAALHAHGERLNAGDADPWALLAAVAGELRLSGFRKDLSRLSASPHPAVAAVARAALIRVTARDDDEPVESEEESLSWFLDPDDLAALRAWASDLPT